jgi:PTS system nitrogen regulatory IIA component
MQISDILIPARIACDVEANSKKRVMDVLADLIAGASPKLARTEVFDSLVARERLGSTGLGDGVAIPHGRVTHCDRAIGAFLKTPCGIDFDAIDNQPVDVFFALLVPENSTEEYLELLSQLAEMFSVKSFLDTLRNEHSPDALYKLLINWSRSSTSGDNHLDGAP